MIMPSQEIKISTETNDDGDLRCPHCGRGRPYERVPNRPELYSCTNCQTLFEDGRDARRLRPGAHIRLHGAGSYRIVDILFKINETSGTWGSVVEMVEDKDGSHIEYPAWTIVELLNRGDIYLVGEEATSGALRDRMNIRESMQPEPKSDKPGATWVLTPKEFEALNDEERSRWYWTTGDLVKGRKYDVTAPA